MKVSLNAYRDLLATYMKPQWRGILILALLLLLSISVQLINPQILRYFIDTALQGSTLDVLVWVALLYLVMALASQLITVTETYVAANIGWKATNRVRSDLALHCLQLDPSFHNEHTPGELIERVDGDVATLNNFFSQFTVHLFGNALLMLGILVMLFRIDWRVGASLTGFSILTLVVLTSLRNVAVPHWNATRQANAELFGYIEERLAGTEDIRSSGATAYVMRRLYERMRDLLKKQIKSVIWGSTTYTSMNLLTAMGVAVTLAIGAYLYRRQEITIGTIFLIFSYSEMLRRPIEQINRQFMDLQMATASIGRIMTLFDTTGSIQKQDEVLERTGGALTLRPGAASVDFDHVSFEYAENDPVLDDLNFHLPSGQVMGLLGRTGSGKTTLIRLLFRLYDPTSGTIRLDGVDLRDIRVADLRSRIGIVTQDIQLFNASVRDNLTFFDRSIPDERIIAVLEDLGMQGWFKSLEDGLDTKLAYGGGGLSAGEAQLLAFTRVFLQDPGLVILDEASSRLDPATERRIEHAIDKLLGGRTGIIIAHRLPTVQRANYIMVLEQGRIREYARREALLSNPSSRFVQMLRTGVYEESKV